MMHHGLEKQAADMGDSMIRNLYEEARIPFAAPEGFNGSCRLHPEALVKAFGSIAKANKVEASALFMLLHSTALKYTAGKYFRPGMVFALLY